MQAICVIYLCLIFTLWYWHVAEHEWVNTRYQNTSVKAAFAEMGRRCMSEYLYTYLLYVIMYGVGTSKLNHYDLSFYHKPQILGRSMLPISKIW